jgi:hypothetical protein
MKNPERILKHLFAVARHAPAPNESEVPFGLETAVVAHWRAARGRATNGNLLSGLRWAAIFAVAIALAAGAVENDQLTAFRSRFDPETRVADSAIVAGFDYE